MVFSLQISKKVIVDGVDGLGLETWKYLETQTGSPIFDHIGDRSIIDPLNILAVAVLQSCNCYFSQMNMRF